MTDLIKLADALENIAQMEYPSAHHDGKNLREAAALLRTAAGVDVAGLIAMIEELAFEAGKSAIYVVSGKPPNTDEHAQLKQAFNDSFDKIESALRLALAASPEDQIIELAQALEQRRALAITDAVHNLPIGGRTANMPTAFQAGYCAACEEIEHRLRTEEWTHCLKPVGAAAPKGTP